MYQSIVIIAAMQSELVHIIPPYIRAVAVADNVFDGVTWIQEDTQIVALRSGIGMVAAAAATEFAIRSWDADAVLNFGCTGAHVRDLYPGDVIIGSASIAHAPQRVDADGVEQFHVTDFGVGSDVAPSNVFPSDSELLTFAEDAAADWTPERWPVGTPPRSPIVRVGSIGSGDIWNQHVERIDRLHAMHGTLCEDMEAAAIAQVAKRHDVPFLTIKDISNNEFHAVTDFGTDGADILEPELGKRAAALLRRTLDEMLA
jgi:adenosylhomocysteine nucleosidase